MDSSIIQGERREEMSHSKLVSVATRLVRGGASLITSLDRVGCSGGNCDEGSNGKKGGKAGEHV
jgi:hypothetical protein